MELIDTAAGCLRGNPDVLDCITRNLGLTALTHGDPRWPVVVALKLFTLDLRDLFRNIRPLVELIGSGRAFYLYDAVATCTNYKGDQWVAAEAAAELAAQVELLAADDVAAGRVVHLQAEYALGRVYHRRANQHSDWGRPLQCQVFSHEVNQVSGLPADVEYDLRSEIIARARRKDMGPDPRTQGLDARELDDAQVNTLGEPPPDPHDVAARKPRHRHTPARHAAFGHARHGGGASSRRYRRGD